MNIPHNCCAPTTVIDRSTFCELTFLEIVLNTMHNARKSASIIIIDRFILSFYSYNIKIDSLPMLYIILVFSCSFLQMPIDSPSYCIRSIHHHY